MSCKIISVMNCKGGVGKTLSLYNLSAAKAMAGDRVLMIDMDPQASLSVMTGIEPFDEALNGHSVNDIFAKEKDKGIETCIFKCQPEHFGERLDIIPANIELASTTFELVNRMNRERILKREISKIESRYDWIFIDTPPTLSVLNLNSLVAATQVIIPTRADYVSFRGLELLEDTINSVIDNELNSGLEVTGVIITMYQKRIKEQQQLRTMIKKKYNLLGEVKMSADATRGVWDGLPAIYNQRKSDVAAAYAKIAGMI